MGLIGDDGIEREGEGWQLRLDFSSPVQNPVWSMVGRIAARSSHLRSLSSYIALSQKPNLSRQHRLAQHCGWPPHVVSVEEACDPVVALRGCLPRGSGHRIAAADQANAAQLMHALGQKDPAM